LDFANKKNFVAFRFHSARFSSLPQALECLLSLKKKPKGWVEAFSNEPKLSLTLKLIQEKKSSEKIYFVWVFLPI